MKSIIEVLIWGTSGRPWKSDLGEFGEYSVYELGRMYFPSYEIAEKRMREVISKKYSEKDVNDLWGSVHHVEMNERPFGSLHCAGDVLSSRMYDSRGREQYRSEISTIFHDDTEDRDLFMGRDESECRFRPGDIVEVQFGEKISCWVVVSIPPSKENAAKWKCLDSSDDCYTVIQTSDYMASHEHVQCGYVFKPRYKVSTEVEKQLKEVYNTYCKENE